jgi:hypothetical protein
MYIWASDAWGWIPYGIKPESEPGQYFGEALPLNENNPLNLAI